MRTALLALLIACSASASAQVGTDVFVQQAGISLTPSTTGLTGASRAEMLRGLIPSTLADDANAAVLDQEGSDNVIEATQRGVGNRLLLSQLGNRLTATFLQDGTNNAATLSLAGNDNTLTHSQIGDNNSYILDLTGSDTEHTVSQVGNDLTATQVVAPGMLPASIEQRGQGAAVTVVRQ